MCVCVCVSVSVSVFVCVCVDYVCVDYMIVHGVIVEIFWCALYSGVLCFFFCFCSYVCIYFAFLCKRNVPWLLGGDYTL